MAIEASRAWLIAFMMMLALLMAPLAHAEDNGKFIVKYAHSKNKVFNDIETIFKSDKEFNNAVQKLNDEFILPQDIIIEFSDDDGPLYDSETRKITMSYDYIFYLSALYLERYPKASDDDMLSFSVSSTIFLFYHEVAHALIDIYHLPVVSSEETAADNLAVIIGLEYTENGYNVVMQSAELFDILDHTTKTYDDELLSDEHALDAQRFYNIICLTYGRYPDRVMSELKDLNNKKLIRFLKEKGVYCKDEYGRQVDGWLRLLDPHLQPIPDDTN